MKALKFTISGMSAFFKNPDVNSGSMDMWFSFPHIHKVAVAGIIGAFMGYGGYRQQSKDDTVPEFWDILKDMKMAVVPGKPIFKKRKVFLTNTTGFANKSKTLAFNESWLVGTTKEPLLWTIYIMDNDSDEFKNICNNMMKNNCKYVPYLGSNHHFCDIKNVEVVDINALDSNDVYIINSIFIQKDGVNIFARQGRINNIHYIQYSAPISLDKQDNHYVYEQHILTNHFVKGADVYTDGTNNLVFY